MTYERFEDLPVWRDAILLAEGCEDFLLAAKERIPPNHPARAAFERKHGPLA